MFKKPIFTGFSPNITWRDTRVALSFLCCPHKWFSIREGENTKKVEEKLKKYFQVQYAYTFDSGRSSLYFALKSLGIGEDDEVLVQGYTCVVVTNAILQNKAKPVYVDVSDDFNMDLEELEKKITKKSKVIILQHTFGLSADMDKVLKIAKKYNLKIIEDCAHAFGGDYKGGKIGTFGDIAMFSFGADKIISCVRGGALITNDQDLAKKIESLQDNLKQTSLLKVIQHLLHYPFFFVGKVFYGIIIGKILLFIAKKFNLINKIIYQEEKRGEFLSFYPAKMPNSLAKILLAQLDEVDIINDKRKIIAKIYDKGINNDKIKTPLKSRKNCLYLRYPILAKNPKEIFKKAKQEGIILGDWYNRVIAPADSLLEKTGYLKGDCPLAEVLSGQTVNLPTNRHIKIKDAEKIISIINSI